MKIIARVNVGVSGLRAAVGKSAAFEPRDWIETLEVEVIGGTFEK